MDIPGLLQELEQLNTKNITITIADDAMSASVCLRAVGHDESYSFDEVMKELSGNGVKMGIDEDKIHTMVAQKQYEVPTVVAVGKPAQDGTDGYYDFFFETEINSKPVARQDGSVDYYNIKLFEKVNEGDKLATYHQPTKGVFGFNITGKLLTPKAGRAKSPIRGKGFKISEDGDTYYAAIDGKVEYRNNDLRVVNVLDISGNVDINVGNVEFNGDVNIHGNIVSGVTVRATGNIYVGGYVEGAVVISDKDIVFNEGVNGKGIGKIEAKGNVSGRFFENATLRLHGNLTTGYILNSNIIADGEVVVEGKKGGIHGGEVTGIMGISARSAGNDSLAPTLLKVGPTKELRYEYAQLIMKTREITSQIEMYSDAINKLNEIKAAGSGSFDQEAYKKVFQSKIIKTAERTRLEEESKYLYNLLIDSVRSVVKIKGTLYQGCKIIVDGTPYAPTGELKHLVVKKLNDKIVVRDYEDD